MNTGAIVVGLLSLFAFLAAWNEHTGARPPLPVIAASCAAAGFVAWLWPSGRQGEA